MDLKTLIKDFFNPSVHRAIKKFAEGGEMSYADRKFSEQALLEQQGYIEKHEVPILPTGGREATSIMYFIWTEKGELFYSLKHPIKNTFYTLAGESF